MFQQTAYKSVMYSLSRGMVTETLDKCLVLYEKAFCQFAQIGVGKGTDDGSQLPADGNDGGGT